MFDRWQQERQKRAELKAEVQYIYQAQDFWKPLLILILLAALMLLSSVLVINSSYDYRNNFHSYQLSLETQASLQEEWQQLLLEQSTLTVDSRLETVAAKKLNMGIPETKQIEFVYYD